LDVRPRKVAEEGGIMATQIMAMDQDVARRRAELMFVAISVGVAIATLVELGSRGAGLALVGLVAWGMLPLASTREADATKRPSLAVLVLAVFHVGFWIAFGRIEHAATTIATARVDALGPIPLELLLVAPVLVLAPLASGLWQLLARRGLEPGIAVKFGLGFVLLAASCFFLALGVEWSAAQGFVGFGALAACMCALALAALCLGPASLAVARAFGARERSGAWVGAWLLCYLLGRAVGGWTSPSTLALDQLFASCMSVGSSAVIAGVALGFLWRPLARLDSARDRAWARGRIARPSTAASVGLASALLLGCSDDGSLGVETRGSTTNPGGTDTNTDTNADTSTSTTSETSDTTEDGGGECGDGVVDPGEVCDDGNDDENDGCTTSCEIGPCGFEWIRSEPMVVPDVLVGMQLEGASMVTATQTFMPEPWTTALSHLSLDDGALESTLALELQLTNETTTSFALKSGGDRFLASFDEADPQTPVHIRRVTSEGELVWQRDRADEGPAWSLATAVEVEDGALVFITTAALGDMDTDAKVVALDPSDGSELWAQSYTGMTAANGYSLDDGVAAAIDAEGRVYAGVTEYVDWDTSAAVAVAYGPGGGDPLWVSELVHAPGHYAELWSLSLGGPGILLATVQEWDGYFNSWIVAVDAQTGDVLWVFDYDDLPIERVWTAAMDVAGDDQRVLAVGYWSYFDEHNGDQQVVQAHTVGLNLDGSLACFGTYDEYEPSRLEGLQSWVPYSVEPAGDGGFYVAGGVSGYFDLALTPELLLGLVR
jgi:cysteine-rich repeat protein